MFYVGVFRADNQRFSIITFLPERGSFSNKVCLLPNSTKVTLSWKLTYTTAYTLLPSRWSKQWNRKTRCHFLTDLNRRGWTPHVTSAGRLHYTALGCARATEILIFTEPAHTHWKINIPVHTTEQAAEPGPTPRPSKHCRQALAEEGVGGWRRQCRGRGPCKPGRGQINNQVWRGKRKESGEKDPWG